MKTIQLIQHEKIPTPVARKKVAAYARVSAETDRLHHSLNAQVDYFKSVITANPQWEFAGVFYDEGLTGTNTRRMGFQSMLRECENGSIDIVLAKSISRFARNTVDMLETTRHLRELGIEIRFEKEGISTLSKDGELMLTLLASFAEEESRSISENVKWALRKRYQNGEVLHNDVFGYDFADGCLVVNEEEAEVVRSIFKWCIEGCGIDSIARRLKGMKAVSRNGGNIGKSSVRYILSNERYCGDTLLQKTVSVFNGSYKTKWNTGDATRYYVSQTHPPIVSKEMFEKAQEALRRHAVDLVFTSGDFIRRPFTSLVRCAKCGKFYRRHARGGYARWVCGTNASKGASACNARGINEVQLKKMSADIIGTDDFDEERFRAEIKGIVSDGNGNFTYEFYSGKRITVYINSKSESCREVWRRIKEERMQHGDRK